MTPNDSFDNPPSAQTAQWRLDWALAQRISRDDPGALDELVDRFGPGLHRLAVSMLSGSADAADLVQETLIAAWREAGRFEGRASLKTWLTRILFKRIAMHRRRSRIRRTAPLTEAESLKDSTHAGSFQQAADARLDIETLLSGLSQEHREVLVLREIEQLGYQEIAALLEVPRGTVESRLFRARQMLRQRFKEFSP